jgi:hypothetical protein
MVSMEYRICTVSSESVISYVLCDVRVYVAPQCACLSISLPAWARSKV